MIGFGVNDKIAPMSMSFFSRMSISAGDDGVAWQPKPTNQCGWAGTGTVRTRPADKSENSRKVIGPLISGDREQHPSLSRYERRRSGHR
jgi:hypothetical protein